MALTVGELVVKLDGDVSGIDRSVQHTEQSLRGLNDTVQKTDGFLKQASSTMVGFAAGMVVFPLMQRGFSFVSDSIVGFNSRLEQSAIGWETMLGSAERADAMLTKIGEFAATSPFAFEDVERGSRRLLAMGFAASDVLPTLENVGNVVAGMGGGAAQIDRVTLALGQMQARGRVTSEELLQLTEAGIPAIRLLAEEMGVTVAEAQKMVTAGEVASETFMTAFDNFAQANFGGMMEAQSKSFQGAMSTISDSVMIASARAFQPLFEDISELSQEIAQFVSSNEFMRWAANVAAALQLVLDGLGLLARGFAQSLSSILQTVVVIGQAIYRALSWLNPFAEHSPSLVDQVERGMGQINEAYEGAAVNTTTHANAIAVAVHGVGEAVTQSAEDIAASAIAAGAGVQHVVDTLGDLDSMSMEELQAVAADLEAKIADLEAGVIDLEDALALIEEQMRVQQEVVDEFAEALEREKEALEEAEEALQSQEDALRDLQDQYDEITAAIREAEDAINDIANATLAEEEAYDKQLDALEDQENQLKKNLREAEKAAAVYDDQISALEETEEKLRDQIEAMQDSGASAESIDKVRDKLEGVQDQIESLVEKQEAMTDPAREALEALQDEISDLELDKALEIDPLKDQLEDAANAALGVEEALTFDESIAAIEDQATALDDFNNELAKVEEEMTAQEAAVAAAQEAVDAHTAAVEAAQAAYDAEIAKLDELQEAHDIVSQQLEDQNGLLQEHEEAYRGVTDAISGLEAALSGAGAAGADAGAGVAGGAMIDQLADIDGYLADAEAAAGDFDRQMGEARENILDFFRDVKSGFDRRVIKPIEDAVTALEDLAGVDLVDVADALGDIFDTVRDMGSKLSTGNLPLAELAGILPTMLPLILPLLGPLGGFAGAFSLAYQAVDKNWFGAGDLFNQGMSLVAEPLERIKTAFSEGGVSGAISQLWTELTTVDWVAVVDAAIGGLITAFETSEQWAAAAQTLATEYAEALAAVDWDNVVEQVRTGIEEAWNNNQPQLESSGFLDDLIDKSLPRLAPSLERVADAAGKLAEIIDKEMGPTIANVKETFGDLEPIINGVAELLGGALIANINVFLTVLAETAPPILQAIFDLFNLLLDIISIWAKLMVEVSDSISALLRGDFSEAFEHAHQAVLLALEGMIEIWTRLPLIVIKLAWELIEALFEVFDSLIEVVTGEEGKLGDFVQGVEDWFIEMGTRGLTAIGDFITDAIDAFLQFVLDAGAEVANVVTAVGDALDALMEDPLGSITDFIAAGVTALFNMATDMLNRAKDVASSVAAGLKDLTSDAAESALGKITGFITAVGTAFGQLILDAKQWGIDIIQGIIDGINEKLGELESLVTGLPGKIKEWGGDMIGNSPAPLGLEIGHDFTDGIAIGIIRGTRDIQVAVENLAATVDRTGRLTPLKLSSDPMSDFALNDPVAALANNMTPSATAALNAVAPIGSERGDEKIIIQNVLRDEVYDEYVLDVGNRKLERLVRK